MFSCHSYYKFRGNASLINYFLDFFLLEQKCTENFMEVLIAVVKKTSRNGFEGMGEKKDGSYIERDKHSIHRRPEQEEGFITVDREEKITYINKTL